jgi:hypothetical protein
MKVIAMTTVLALGGCPPQQQGPVYGGGTVDAPYRTAEQLVRRERIETESAIDGVLILAKPFAGAGWTIGIKNETDASISILWDESTFVANGGSSQGRLIRGETRRMDVGRSQPPTPLAPKADMVQRVLVEKALAYEEIEARMDGSLRDRDEVSKILEIRRVRQESIVGGRVHLVIDVGGTKKTWTGIVRPPQSRQTETVEDAPTAKDEE